MRRKLAKYISTAIICLAFLGRAAAGLPDSLRPRAFGEGEGSQKKLSHAYQIISSKLAAGGLRILYVCTRNNFRSVAAHITTENIIRRLNLDKKIYVSSAGINNCPDTVEGEAKTILLQRGFDSTQINDFVPTDLEHEMIRGADIILCAANKHVEKILRLDAMAVEKTFLMTALFPQSHTRYRTEIEDDRGEGLNLVVDLLWNHLKPFLEKQITPEDANAAALSSVLRPRAAGEKKRPARELSVGEKIDTLYEKLRTKKIRGPDGDVTLADLTGRTSWFHGRNNVDANLRIELDPPSSSEAGPTIRVRVYPHWTAEEFNRYEPFFGQYLPEKRGIGTISAVIAYVDNRPVLIVKDTWISDAFKGFWHEHYDVSKKYNASWQFAGMEYLAAVAGRLGIRNTDVYVTVEDRHLIKHELLSDATVYRNVSFGKNPTPCSMRRIRLKGRDLASFFEHGPHFEGLDIIGSKPQGIWTLLKARPRFSRPIRPENIHLAFNYKDAYTGFWSDAEAIWDPEEEVFVCPLSPNFIEGTFRVSYEGSHDTWMWTNAPDHNIGRKELEERGVVIPASYGRQPFENLYDALKNTVINTPDGPVTALGEKTTGRATWFHGAGEVDVNMRLRDRYPDSQNYNRRFILDVFPCWPESEYLWGDRFLKTTKPNMPDLAEGSIGRLLIGLGYVNGGPAFIIEEIQSTEAFGRMAMEHKEVVQRYDLYWILAGMEYLAAITRHLNISPNVYMMTAESAKTIDSDAWHMTQRRRYYHEPGRRLEPARPHFVLTYHIKTLTMHRYPVENARDINTFWEYGPRFLRINLLGMKKEGRRKYLLVNTAFSKPVDLQKAALVLTYGDPAPKQRWQEVRAVFDTAIGSFRVRIPDNFIEGAFKFSHPSYYGTWRWLGAFGQNITRARLDALPVSRMPGPEPRIIEALASV